MDNECRKKRKVSILNCKDPKKNLSSKELEEYWENYISNSEEEPFQDSGSEYIVSGESDTNSSTDSSFDEGNLDGNSITSDVESEEDNNIDCCVWDECTYQRQPVFPFTGLEDINIPFNAADAKPIDYYKLFVSDDVIDLMVTETNKNAERFLENNQVKRSSRYKDWKNTNALEMKIFLGLRLWMGLVHMPSLESYWSDKKLYKNEISSFMTRNRFQLLLRFWHFGEDIQGDRLCKIRPLLDLIHMKFQHVKSPGQNLVIDESMVPFTGRLNFKQYIPGKAHKYGIKLFKLCDQTGYTYKTIPYSGKKNEINTNCRSLASNIVISLMEPYLGQGRTLCTDNYYTSIPLIHELLEKKTYFVGTFRKNRKQFPKEVTDAKLKRGECKVLENSKGVVALKWKDKRDVYCVSSKFSGNLVPTGKKNKNDEEIIKPDMIIKYNTMKSGIDISDQLASYHSAIRKSIRWYHKVADDVIFGTSVVNAYLIYISTQNIRKKLKLLDFRMKIVYSLLDIPEDQERSQTPRSAKSTNHYLDKTEVVKGGKTQRAKRSYCKYCYERISATSGRQEAKSKAKKVSTYCKSCPDKPFLCFECFEKVHNPNK